MIPNRRKFIKKLGLLLTTMPLLSFSATKKLQGFQLCTLKVAGLQYGQVSNGTFMPTDTLVLVREPNNTYDKYAVAIYKDTKRVGYIPRENARIIASLLDNGKELEAEVRYFDKEKDVWNRLWVGIWQVG